MASALEFAPWLKTLSPRLCLVTDRSLSEKGDLTGPVTRALMSGVRLVQLREKDLGGRPLLIAARRLRALTSEYGARFIVNERVDVALLTDADGVHLGQDSFSPRDVRPVLRQGMALGVSTHSLEEALKAEEEGASYITLGPIYHTPSKERYGDPLGIETLRTVSERLRIPVFAIGGIKKGRIREVLDAGAYGAAVISAIFGSDDMERDVKGLLEGFVGKERPLTC